MTLRRRFLRWRIRRRIRLVKQTVRFVDKKLAEMGAPAQKRQQLRRDIITSDEAWVDFINILGEG